MEYHQNGGMSKKTIIILIIVILCCCCCCYLTSSSGGIIYYLNTQSNKPDGTTTAAASGHNNDDDDDDGNTTAAASGDTTAAASGDTTAAAGGSSRSSTIPTPDSKFIQYGNLVTLMNKAGDPNYLASCGMDVKYCDSNHAVYTYRYNPASYIKTSPNSGKWKIYTTETKTGVLNYGDYIQLKNGEDNWHLVTCGGANDKNTKCNDSSIYSVSTTSVKITTSSADATWQIIQSNGLKTGKPVSIGDSIKLQNVYRSQSYLMTCGTPSKTCHPGQLYTVFTCTTDSSDSKNVVSDWVIKLDYTEK
jgi:hypothetical protein